MRKSKFFPALALLLFLLPSASPQLERNDSERQLFEFLNQERTAQGFPALRWDEALFKAARKHALRMADLNLLEHQLPNEADLEGRLAEAGAHFSVIAENIAYGGTPQSIHHGWMNSPGHRKNILDPRLTAVGIAAVHGQGALFAVQDFSQAVPELSTGQQEQKMISLLTARGFHAVSSSVEARRACEAESGFGGSNAKSMLRVELTDLDKLPEDIEKKLRGNPLAKAQVGACHANTPPGFTRYRIAVLFF